MNVVILVRITYHRSMKNLLKLIILVSTTLLLSSCYFGSPSLNGTGQNNVYCQRVEMYQNLLAQPNLTPEEKAKYRKELQDNFEFCEEFGGDKLNEAQSQKPILPESITKPTYNPYKPSVF